MTHNPFRRTAVKPKRDKQRRVRDRKKLDPVEYRTLRNEAAVRAGGKCECGCGKNAYLSLRRPHPDAGEFAHNEHGSRKSDELSRGRWLNWQCHEKSHNAGGKPCNRKSGRMMTKTEAQNYLAGTKCFCGKPKLEKTSFCEVCRSYLSPQQRLDLETLENTEFLKCLADCEQTLLLYITEKDIA